MDDLDEGVHGTEKVKDRKEYDYCIECHHPHYEPFLDQDQDETATSVPPSPVEDKECLECHGFVEPEDPKGKEKIDKLCFHCHGHTGTEAQDMTAKSVQLINKVEYQATTHADTACTACHSHSAQFKHTDKRLGECVPCHVPHDEKVARGLHMTVACEVCHLNGIVPVRDPESKRVFWERERKLGEISKIHQMILGDDEAECKRCHFKGNQVGAVSMILPAKSILCMPCHAATFSLGDTTTIVALMVFLLGVVMIFSYWLSGSMAGDKDANLVTKLFKLFWHALRIIFSSKIFLIMKAMILDVLLQRRLYRQSEVRWLIHSLIFLPFVFRFSWGLVALLGSLWKPEWSQLWAMLDKNHPTTAFLFDLTGIVVILGVVLASIRGSLKRPGRVSGLPKQDRLALGLIAGIVVIGFILEGIRIAMAGWPEGVEYAFAGYGVSLIFSNASGLTEVYGYIWYIHAILTGAFVAYLPFSRLFHIIMAPVVLAINAVSEHGNR
jgi:predicted CXXCH cytochrome family protein